MLLTPLDDTAFISQPWINALQKWEAAKMGFFANIQEPKDGMVY